MIYNTPLRERLYRRVISALTLGVSLRSHLSLAHFAVSRKRETADPLSNTPMPKKHESADLFLPFPSLSKIAPTVLRGIGRPVPGTRRQPAPSSAAQGLETAKPLRAFTLSRTLSQSALRQVWVLYSFPKRVNSWHLFGQRIFAFSHTANGIDDCSRRQHG